MSGIKPEKEEKASIKLFHNCTIITLDDKDQIAEAMALHNGKILCVGSESEVAQYINNFNSQQRGETDVESIELNGKYIVPGFIDSHMHPGVYIFFKAQLNLSKIRSYEDLKSTINEYKNKKDQDEWILGYDLMEDLFSDPNEHIFPDRYKLDEICSDNPILILRHDGHICTTNSKALELIGVNKSSVRQLTPENGEIKIDKQGEPTGIFTEGATSIAMSELPIPSLEDLKGGAQKAWNELASFGITTIGGILQTDEEGIAGKAGAMEVQLIQLMIREIGIKQDLVLYFSTNRPKKLKRLKRKFDRLSRVEREFEVGGLKLYADGSFGARTAYLFEPYSDSEEDLSGFMTIKEEDLYKKTKNTLKLGFQTICHSIGDKSTDIVLNTFEKVVKDLKDESELLIDTENMLRIEHASQLNDDILKKASKLGVIFACQPAFINSEYTWLKNRLGKERLKYTYPFKSILSAGITLSGASDAPIESAEVLEGIKACVIRKGFVPEECISVKEALKVFTKYAAKGINQVDIKGTLEQGKIADFVVLNADPLSIDENNQEKELNNLKVLRTYHRGKRTY
ncbi:MAG: amidohydrolase family protein [Candidatus Lokiarchaeota archaeon]|nr:amidohydrolase family protein [Candidatus Lokiarchaeota archaeon]